MFFLTGRNEFEKHPQHEWPYYCHPVRLRNSTSNKENKRTHKKLTNNQPI